MPSTCRSTPFHDAEGAPYLRYFNHKMKREALVPIDEELEQQLRDHQRRILEEWPAGVSVLFPRADANLRGDRPISTSGYGISLAEWLQLCETRDELGRPAHITQHQFRHTLGTRLINKDVPQEVVRQILDHTSAQMTAHYARLSDTTVRRHWEKARKVNAQCETRRSKTTASQTPVRRPPMPPEPNTAPLAAAARKRRELTRAKAIQALREVDRTGAPVSFEGVARRAGISRSWLYG